MTPETAGLRNSVRARCERDILDFFENAAGQVAIYDANNGTKKSRRALYDRFHKLGYHVIFLGMFDDVSFSLFTLLAHCALYHFYL
jgi:6-phosphofructo-2-kinase/fructose-2,6-biphosphatase 4